MKGETSMQTAPRLPRRSMELLHDIIGGTSLGASRNIRQINELLVSIAEESARSSSDETKRLIMETADYLAATRGKNTPAIRNAIQHVLRGFEDEDPASSVELRTFLLERKDEYQKMSIRNRDLIAAYGANLLEGANAILAFDYSSSMMAILKELSHRNKLLEVVTPESRALRGGFPIAKESLAMGHSVTYIMDIAYRRFLPRCDAVLIGAETIFIDGSAWNTVGSHPIAIAARQLGIPYYVATELIKIDPESIEGKQRALKEDDFTPILDPEEDLKATGEVSMVAPELDRVPPELISGYVTPSGILLPAHIRSKALEFLGTLQRSVARQ